MPCMPRTFLRPNLPCRLALLGWALAAPLFLAGCDQLGLESATALASRKEAEAKAIGAGCRHAARSVEQCYVLNKRADKAAVFAGWKDMNDYMRENKIDAIPAAPTAPASAPVDAVAVAEAGEAGAKPDAKPEAAAAAKAGKP
jgi:hypothetical protein